MSEESDRQKIIDRLCVKFKTQITETLQDIDEIYFLCVEETKLYVARTNKGSYLTKNATYILDRYQAAIPKRCHKE